jgi:hypothetical protein
VSARERSTAPEIVFFAWWTNLGDVVHAIVPLFLLTSLGAAIPPLRLLREPGRRWFLMDRDDE